MAVVPIIMAAAAVISAGVSVANTVESRKQARAARQQAAFEEAKSRRRVLAEQRVLRARTLAQAEAQGVSGSSSVQGALSSLQQQGADTISFQQNVAGFQARQARSQQRMNTFSAVGDLANATFSTADTFRVKE